MSGTRPHLVMAARETCPPIPREGNCSQFLGDELTQMAVSHCLEGEPPCGESESPDEETFPSIQHQIPGMIAANISTHTSNISIHRKAHSLDYRTGDRGTHQSLSGSLCALSQAGVSERAVAGFHPCADRQWGSSSFTPMRALVPPLPTTPGDWSASSTPVVRRRTLSHSSTEHGRQAQEQEGDTQRGGTLQVTPPTPLLIPARERRLSKRERNRLKILRRNQRRRERWVHCQLQENTQSSSGNATSSSEEDEEECFASAKEGFICAVCLDVYYCPYMCHPCSHVFCEPCLRTLARPSPTRTPCPLCRTLISQVFFQKELNHTTRTFFPEEYLSRKQNFHRASCSKWPLPSCRKRFRIFGGFRRQASSITQRQFPHSGYRLDALDLEDDARGWRFDMDMVIIYIYSVNWVIGFIALCFLCYFLFPSL